MKKSFYPNQIAFSALISLLLVASSGCGLSKSPQSATSSAIAANNQMNAQVAGNGNTAVPTANAITGRIELGLMGTVSHTGGNFRNALANLSANLPDSVNPLQATGLDQIPLLVYSACSDANPSNFGVNASSSVSAAKASLVAAGVKMLDQHVAGLASGGPSSAQVSAVFSTLVDQDSAAGDSTSLTFISVCMAANSYGVAMKGF